MRGWISLHRLSLIPLLIPALYSILLGLLTIPAVQREALFLHRIQIPLFSKYNNPERYGLAPYKTRNFYLNTPDGETLGLWHVLAQGDPPTSSLADTVFEGALKDRPTIIYFHGNAGTRAQTHRVRGYTAFSNTLDVNVVAVDYRGFGDSTGTPSEAGLLIDARTVYDHISNLSITSSGPQEASGKIVLAGQSLGTGVVSALAGSLAKEGIYPRALVLIAPFTSIATLLLDYKLFWVIPLLSPLKAFPRVQQWLLSSMEAKFDSAASLVSTRSPTLIFHAVDDDIIPHHHSKALFDHLYNTHTLRSERTGTLEEQDYPGWGRTSSFDRKKDEGGRVIWWEGLAGGHNHIGWAEGTIDLIEQIAQLGPSARGESKVVADA